MKNHTQRSKQNLNLRIAFITLAILFATGITQAADYSVTNTNDSGAGSLRDAIDQANAAGSDDVITFDPIIFAAPQTITLGGTELVIENNGSLAINGPAAGVSISGNNASRVLLNNVATVFLQDLTITGGAQGSGPGISGAGIFNYGGTMTLKEVTVSGNTASSGFFVGGGIYNAGGTMTLNDTTVSNNSSAGFGGGGITNLQGTMTITNSTVSNNSATNNGGGGIINAAATMIVIDSTVKDNSMSGTGQGGGIASFNLSTLTVIGSTISGNFSSNDGGGIFSEFGTTTVTNSTISGNSAVRGGGIVKSLSGQVTLTNTTVSANSASIVGGGVLRFGGEIRADNTIFADNTSPVRPDYAGSVISLGYNLFETPPTSGGDLPTDLVGVEPLLGPLQDNGGPTFTHALLPGSFAIDAGNSTLTADQRGVPRPVDFLSYPNAANGSDIGAFELRTPPTDKNQCKNGFWRTFTIEIFRNQGDCVSFVQTGR